MGGLIFYSRVKLAESAAQSYTRVPMTEPEDEKSSGGGATETASTSAVDTKASIL